MTPPCSSIAIHHACDHSRAIVVRCHGTTWTTVIGKTARRVALGATALCLTGATVVASSTYSTGAEPIDSSSASSIVAPRAIAAPTAGDVRAQTIRKYGVHPLPTSVRTITKYKLGKKALREIVAAKKLANTTKAKRIRKCESGGSYKINTGNGYYGAYQFDRGTWLSNGGGRYARTANRAPKFAQDHIMYKTYKARGWSPWACQ